MSAWVPCLQIKHVWDESRQSLHACTGRWPAVPVKHWSFVVVILRGTFAQVLPHDKEVEANANKNRRCFYAHLPTKQKYKIISRILILKESPLCFVVLLIEMFIYFRSETHTDTHSHKHPKGCRRPHCYLIFHQADRAVSVSVELTLQQLFHQAASRVASSGYRSQLCWM